jgi:hypothetical protein
MVFSRPSCALEVLIPVTRAFDVGEEQGDGSRWRVGAAGLHGPNDPKFHRSVSFATTIMCWA